MTAQTKPSESIIVLSVIDPDANTAATYTGDWADTSLCHKFMATFLVGTMASTSTLEASIFQATDSSGTGAKAVANCAAVQLTEAGTDSDKQVIINCSVADLDIAGGFTFIAPRMVIATAASDSGAVLYGVTPYYATITDLASVDEIVN